MSAAPFVSAGRTAAGRHSSLAGGRVPPKPRIGGNRSQTRDRLCEPPAVRETDGYGGGRQSYVNDRRTEVSGSRRPGFMNRVAAHRLIAVDGHCLHPEPLSAP
jgi:hypothetical protein